MKIKEITDIIEGYAPLATALEYDNVGLLVGSNDKECTGILVCVDVTRRALAAAKENGCNLIISHHPIIFTPMKRFLSDDYQAALIADAFTAGIALYAAHTNIDRIEKNMSYRLLTELGAKNVTQFYDGLGAVGELEKIKLADLEKKVKTLLSDDNVFTVGEKNKIVSRVAEINGAGADNEAIAEARRQGVDLFISGDLKHHIMLEACETGLALMSVGHYASEKSFVSIISDSIKCHFDTTIIDYYEGNPYNN